MDKEKMIHLFRFENYAFGAIVLVISITLFFLGERGIVKGISIGMMIGCVVGVALNHFVKIPKIFEEKDEREIILSLFSLFHGLSMAFVITTILFAFSVFDIIEFDTGYYVITAMGIGFIAFFTRTISYKVLNNYM